jgi:glycerol kinase
VFIGGAVVQWLRDGLRAIKASGEVQALAESVPDAGGVMFVPAFTGLGAPYWNADARGAITGLTRGSTVAHIARAALESIAFQSAALLQAMSRDAVAAGGSAGAELRVDGGACVNDLLMQFQADLLGIPVVRPKVIETTALGAAYLAGLATGVPCVFRHPVRTRAQRHRPLAPGCAALCDVYGVRDGRRGSGGFSLAAPRALGLWAAAADPVPGGSGSSRSPVAPGWPR